MPEHAHYWWLAYRNDDPEKSPLWACECGDIKSMETMKEMHDAS